MSTIVINYRYKNYDFWKKNYEADRTRREILGITDVCIGKKPDDPFVACIVWEADQPHTMKCMVMDPLLKMISQEKGTEYADIFIVEDTEALEYSLLMPGKKIPYNYCSYQPQVHVARAM